ncbi:MAG: glycosyltransferase [Urechidicola sp.]|nr:glycosyltransferase [Urechidicola sp.]
MKFAIITHVVHKKEKQQFVAYEPYVREMNLWLKNVDEVQIVAPLSEEEKTAIDSKYIHRHIEFNEIHSFDITSIKNSFTAIFKMPIICFRIYKTMKWADHIHLRCPSNVVLLGCFVQMLFPSKQKTVKYAGNWDPKSKQPFSYRLQKWILSNTLLTKNTKVLVYGEWGNQSKNIIPFFTASYSRDIIKEIKKKNLSEEIRFIFVGGLTMGKQPLKSVQVVQQLKEKGFNVRLDIYGDGVERGRVDNYINQNQLSSFIILHGNSDKEIVTKAYQQAHFLVFISKSEGWPKVVAEAMFWSCLPITTEVSCVPFMIDYGNRGALVTDTIEVIVNKVDEYLNDEVEYQKQIEAAKNWSQQFTLEKFETEIKKLLKK